MRSSPGVYRIAGLRLASALPLVPLPRVAGPPDWEVVVDDGPPPACDRWFHHWYEPGGALWLSFGRLGDGFLLRFAHSLSVEVQPSTRRVCCHASARTPRATIRHLLLNQVVPLLLASPARLALHASAVALPGGVVAFVGAGGSGKSTLAAAMVALGGARLVTDDVLVLGTAGEGVTVSPAAGEVRLWEDMAAAIFGQAGANADPVSHYTSKRRVDDEALLRPLAGEAPLAALCLIDGAPSPRAPVTLTPLSPRDAARALTECAFVLDVEDRETRRRVFEQIAEVSARVAAVRLGYPHDVARLGEVIEAVDRALVPAVVS